MWSTRTFLIKSLIQAPGCKSGVLFWRCAARMPLEAKVAELVDALDLGSSAARRAGSSPAFRTNLPQYPAVDKPERAFASDASGGRAVLPQRTLATASASE